MYTAKIMDPMGPVKWLGLEEPSPSLVLFVKCGLVLRLKPGISEREIGWWAGDSAYKNILPKSTNH